MKAVKTTVLALFLSNAAFAQTSSDVAHDMLVKDVESSFTGLASTTLTSFRTVAPIEINVNLDIKDSAETSRYYTDYAKTDKCVVNVNPDYYIYMKQRTNPMSEAGFTETDIKEFIFMHELAHCLESEPAPQNVDEFAWRESFADGYATYMVHSHHTIRAYMLGQFAKFRKKTNKDGGAAEMLSYILNKAEITDNEDPLVAIEKVKQMRRQIFTKNM